MVFGKKKKQEEKNELNQANTKNIRIVIWKPMSKDSVMEAADFIVEEKRDPNNNVLGINEKFHFKEDLDFKKERVYEVMDYNLNLTNLKIKEKAEELKVLITAQEKLLVDITEDKLDSDDREQYNYQDEDLKLRQLKVYLESLYRDKVGNYLRLGKNGLRQYEFVVVDGVLRPYFFGLRIFSASPDLTTKKKMFNQENSIFRNETNLQNKVLPMTLVILIGCFVLGGMANMYWAYHNMTTSNEMSELITRNGIICENTLASLTAKYGLVVDDWMTVKQNEAESVIKNQNLNTNSQSTIDISPSGNVANN